MVTLGERIKKVRRDVDLTQQIFADRIGIKQNSVALIESGKRNTSDQVLLAICREFHVNEKWLRTGEGEMFAPAVTDELEALADRYPNLTHESLVLIEKLVNLSPEKQDVISGFLREVVKGFGDVNPGTRAKPGENLDRETLHEMLDDHISLEKTPEATSEVS